MKIEEKKNQWYPNGYYESKSGLFAIGIINELFKRIKIQVLFKDFDDWSVIREWVTYDDSLSIKQIVKIISVMSGLPDNTNKWKKVEEVLPDNKKKYLEDK